MTAYTSNGTGTTPRVVTVTITANNTVYSVPMNVSFGGYTPAYPPVLCDYRGLLRVSWHEQLGLLVFESNGHTLWVIQPSPSYPEAFRILHSNGVEEQVKEAECALCVEDFVRWAQGA